MRLVVEAAGTQTLIQDLGRPGSMHLGVPPSGALDPAALALANRLVGNPDDAAGFEVLLGGLRFRVDEALRIAVTGAQMGVRIGRRPASWGVAESIPAGESLELRPTPDGLRCWVAVAGGVAVDPVLGSCASDTLTGLGPRPLADGMELQLGKPRGQSVPGAEAVPIAHPGVFTLPMTPGPRDDWFSPEALQRLFTQEYAVAPDSNRTALRLKADDPLERARTEELPSEGIVTGAVQVPAGGQPLVFLADHPVTGGYPVVGVVSPSAVSACAQARPGDRVRFRPARVGARRNR